MYCTICYTYIEDTFFYLTGTTTHHCETLGEDDGCFLITFVYKEALKRFPNFNQELHSNGSVIIWNKKLTTTKKEKSSLEKPGTEALCPKLFKYPPKLKRNPNDWVHNLRKKAYNCGETFTHQFTYGKKKGKKITIKERRMGPPCHCKKQCTSILNQASRQEIVSSFKKLSNITEKKLFILKCVKRNSKARSKKRQIENEGRLRKREYSYK